MRLLDGYGNRVHNIIIPLVGLAHRIHFILIQKNMHGGPTNLKTQLGLHTIVDGHIKNIFFIWDYYHFNYTFI